MGKGRVKYICPECGGKFRVPHKFANAPRCGQCQKKVDTASDGDGDEYQAYVPRSRKRRKRHEENSPQEVAGQSSKQKRGLVASVLQWWGTAAFELCTEFGLLSTRPVKRGQGMVIGVGFLVSVLTLCYVVSNVRNTARSVAWDSVRGQVTDIRWTSTRTGRRTRRTRHVTYAFNVGSDAFEGHRLGFGGDDRGFRHLCEGRPVTVYYSPSAPSDCVLDRSFPVTKTILGSVLGCFCFFFAGGNLMYIVLR